MSGGSHVVIHAKQVGIFTATRWELNAVRQAFTVETEHTVRGMRCLVGRSRHSQLFLFQTGIGNLAARSAVKQAAAAQKFDLLISSGFACALAAAGVGDLLIGTEVMQCGNEKERPGPGRNLSCSSEVVALAAQVGQLSGLSVHTGGYVTVPRILSRAAEKRVIAKRTGAIAADMESAAVCAEGQARGIPVLVARTASDLVDEDLPVDFNHFLTPGGWLRGIAYFLAHPASLGGLNRMRVQSAVAAERLARFFDKFFPAFAA